MMAAASSRVTVSSGANRSSPTPPVRPARRGRVHQRDVVCARGHLGELLSWDIHVRTPAVLRIAVRDLGYFGIDDPVGIHDRRSEIVPGLTEGRSGEAKYEHQAEHHNDHASQATLWHMRAPSVSLSHSRPLSESAYQSAGLLAAFLSSS